MADKLIVQDAETSDEWPEPVKRAFIEFAMAAASRGFNVMAVVGMNLRTNQPGSDSYRLTAMLSPRASSNPYRAQMCEDISRMFSQMANRSRQ